MVVFSKPLIKCTCQEFQHPWTSSCSNAVAGVIFSCTPYCLKLYTVVYLLSFVMRRRIPSKSDVKKTVLSIIQSSAFLVTNAYTFVMFGCLMRRLLGGYYMLTAGFMPTFLASMAAIVVERPQRRPLLALYVANLATESLWGMAESRGLVKSIAKSQVIIFGISISVLLYLYRLGIHKTKCKDTIFDIIRLFIDKSEEGPRKQHLNIEGDRNSHRRRSSLNQVNFFSVANLVQIYINFYEAMLSKHVCCPHRKGCVANAVTGGLRNLLGGVGLQIAFNFLMNFKIILRKQKNWYKNLLNRKTLNLSMFLGSFTFLYKAICCGLRRTYEKDDPKFAIPAALISSVSFIFYPNVTLALYVMWKMLQIVYNLGIDAKKLPHIPGFTLYLYSFCTAVLFHSGILEPLCLRGSYYKFLQNISGERFSKFNVTPFDVLGLNSSYGTAIMKARLNIVDKSPLPRCSLADW